MNLEDKMSIWFYNGPNVDLRWRPHGENSIDVFASSDEKFEMRIKGLREIFPEACLTGFFLEMGIVPVYVVDLGDVVNEGETDE